MYTFTIKPPRHGLPEIRSFFNPNIQECKDRIEKYIIYYKVNYSEFIKVEIHENSRIVGLIFHDLVFLKSDGIELPDGRKSDLINQYKAKTYNY